MTTIENRMSKSSRKSSHNRTTGLFQLAQHARQDLFDKLLDLVLLLWLLMLLVVLLRILMRLLMRWLRGMIRASSSAWVLSVVVILGHVGWSARQVDIDTPSVLLGGILQT